MADEDRFINLKLTEDTLDIYNVRRSILRALKEHIPLFEGVLLDVGCGQMPYRDLIMSGSKGKVSRYIGMDLDVSSIHDTSVADLLWDGKTMPLGDNSVDCVMATEVLEHCFEPEQILGEIFRVLKPGGKFFFTVPFLWPLHEVPFDAYRYTPFALDKLFREAGFSRNEIKALGGWDASLAQMMGLWVRRRPLAGLKRKLLSKLALISVKYLLSKDERPEDLNGSHMITGLTGIVIK